MDIALDSYKSIMTRWKGKRNPSPVCNTANAVTCEGICKMAMVKRVVMDKANDRDAGN
jgi:hypothetical protein